MNPFRVWVGPLGTTVFRVRVEGVKNAHWLLSRLSRDYVFKTSEPIHERDDSSDCSFEVACRASLSGMDFERLLAAIPPVQLMLEPEE